jgi:hypothetical protein
MLRPSYPIATGRVLLRPFGSDDLDDLGDIYETAEVANTSTRIEGFQLLIHPLCECALLSVKPGLDELDRGEPAVRCAAC